MSCKRKRFIFATVKRCVKEKGKLQCSAVVTYTDTEDDRMTASFCASVCKYGYSN